MNYEGQIEAAVSFSIEELKEKLKPLEQARRKALREDRRSTGKAFRDAKEKEKKAREEFQKSGVALVEKKREALKEI